MKGPSTFKTLTADILDLREYDFKTRAELLQAIEDTSRRYSIFAPHLLPDKVLLTPEQRELLPQGNFIRSPYSVIEINVK